MERFSLHDGTGVTIRPIAPDDRPRLQAAHARLSPDTQYKRFLAPKPHLTTADARYLVEIDGSDHFALVATLDDDPELIIGVARFVRLPEGRHAAEFAIVVGDRFQGQGLASEMLERLADAALARGIQRFRATILSGNHGAHRMVRRFSGGSANERHLGEIDEVEIDLVSGSVARAPGLLR